MTNVHRLMYAVIALVSGWSLYDRASWVEQTTHLLSAQMVPSLQDECGNRFIEVDASTATGPLPYRCGVIFWPFYHSGTSTELRAALPPRQ